MDFVEAVERLNDGSERVHQLARLKAKVDFEQRAETRSDLKQPSVKQKDDRFGVFLDVLKTLSELPLLSGGELEFGRGTHFAFSTFWRVGPKRCSALDAA